MRHPLVSAPRRLIARRDLNRRVVELAREIRAYYGARKIYVIALMHGALLFAADLLRRLPIDTGIFTLCVHSYGSARRPGRPRLASSLPEDAAGRHLLVVDDILDSGGTLNRVLAALWKLKPASVRTCVLVRKRVRRKPGINPSFVGFDVPDVFVVGYGIDLAGMYRNLPYLGFVEDNAQ